MNIRAYIESGVIESYVLGMADTQEAAELEQLCRQYPEIKQAVDAFEASLEASAFANAVTAPASVKDKLMFTLQDEFAKEKKSVPAVIASISQPNPVKTINQMKYAAAASVILLLGSSALNIYFYSQVRSINDKYIALFNEKNNLEANINIYKTKTLDIYNSMQLMSDPAMIKVSMPGIKGKENNLATVFWDRKTKDVYLLANKLPQTPADKQYQLWALVDGKPVDAGLLGDCNGLCKLKNIQKAQSFAITLENKGGSPTPHLDQLYVLGNVTI